MKKLLEKRNTSKSKKPKFLRHDSNKYSFNNKWRKPRGLHNKRRLSRKGHQKNPSTGYGSPKEVKYLNKEGLNRVNINNIQDLEKVNKEKDIAIISRKLGMKKKLIILEKILELNIQIENIKDIKKYIEEQKSLFEEKKKEKQKKLAEKAKSKKEAEKKAKEKEKKKEPEEDKQKEIKEEVMGAKQEIKEKKIVDVKKDTTSAKIGHQASSVPGTKQ
jgi:large subunit ribosomal protein L32e|tara:strand:+ start:72 stop:722 length:651 start_codon:yes stop_codon:yes gene_type:complete